MNNAIRELQVWNQLLVICLNNPSRPTWGQPMHFYDQTPSFNQITQQKCQSNGLEWRNSKMCLIFAGSGPPTFRAPPNDHPPTDPSELTHLYTN